MTPQQLAICTGCSDLALAAKVLPDLAAAMSVYGISSRQNVADFLANVGHESGGLRYTSEIWGPTKAQIGYEGRKDLGNIEPGDGRRFRGHGYLQTTGRWNHARVRERLMLKFPNRHVPDFERYPEMLALPEWAALSAADFWDEHKIKAYSDAGDFDGVCDIINRGRKTAPVGDSNGYAARRALQIKALEALK